MDAAIRVADARLGFEADRIVRLASVFSRRLWIPFRRRVESLATLIYLGLLDVVGAVVLWTVVKVEVPVEV